MNESKFISYINLARKAGCVVYGLDNITQNKKICLILCSLEMSKGNREKLKSIANMKNIPIYEVENLSIIFGSGKTYAVGIKEPNLAHSIENILK